MALINTPKTYTATPSGGTPGFEFQWTITGSSSYTTSSTLNAFGSANNTINVTWTSLGTNNVDVCVREASNPDCVKCSSFTVGVTSNDPCAGSTLTGVSISES